MSSVKTMKHLERGTKFLLKSIKPSGTLRNGGPGRHRLSAPGSLRQFSSSTALHKIYKSRFDDLQLEQKPLGQFMLEKFEKFGDRIALVIIFSQTYVQQIVNIHEQMFQLL